MAPRRQAIPRDMSIGIGIAAVLLAAMGNHAIYAGVDVTRSGSTAAAFLGIVLTTVIGALHGLGRFVLDYARIVDAKGRVVRRDARNLLAVGAAAMGSMAVHASWLGVTVAQGGDTVPGFLGSSLPLLFGSLTAYGTWVLEFSKPPSRATHETGTGAAP